MKMSSRMILSATVLLVLVLLPGAAHADWKTFWHKVHVGFHRNNAWPQPFNEADALQVKQPFEIMKANGWRLHNTIGNDLFRPGDGSLLSAGQKRLQWIATQAPPARRQVFILRAATQEETNARIESVQEAMKSSVSPLSPPEIFVTEVAPPTISGSWATRINREWLENMAAPKLPDQTTTGQPGVGSSASSK